MQETRPNAGPEGGQAIVLGMGTGRCGTHTLAELLNRQPDASFTHEQPPLLPWRPVPDWSAIRERLRRLRGTRPQRLIGDVALFYLPYVEEAIALEPEIRVICLERPREEVVASFCRWADTIHPLPTDHWADEPPAGWHHDPIWSRIFPKYAGLTSREERIGRYWDEYHREAAELARRYPANVRIFPTEALNVEAGVRDILTFAGVPSDRQVVLTDLRSAAVGTTHPHPRHALLAGAPPGDPRRCVILVPYTSHIAPACEAALRELERRGYPVWRVGGYAAIDQGRSQMATDALAQGFEETMWIDSDIGFEPDAVERLRSLVEPIVSGVYAQKGRRTLACHVLPGTRELVFGEGGGLVEVLYAAGGFLLVRRRVYMDILRRFDPPLCNEPFGRPLIPFFRPMVRPWGDGAWYLAEDFAFCEAARQCGHRILADTSVRLWHLGQYAYGWEDAGTTPGRYATFNLRLGPTAPSPDAPGDAE